MNQKLSIAPARLERIREFLAEHAFSGAELLPLPGDASFRRYIRIRGKSSMAMLMDAPPEKEALGPYMRIAAYLHRHGYSAPAILAHSVPDGLLLIEDLGDDSYTSLLAAQAAKKPAQERELYEAAIDVLAEWHGDRQRFANHAALTLPLYDEPLLMQEISLFCDWYLPQVLGKAEAAALRPEYLALWREILAHTPPATEVWVHRDYHADNLMWLPGRQGTKRVGLLDFQDGVYGDAAYDLVSLLEDARRDVPLPLAEAMLGRYITASGVGKDAFMAAYAVLGAQRNSKIVGIFSRLAARDNKFTYLNYLPRVWKHLEHDLKHPALAKLKAWLDKYVPASQRGVIAIQHTSQQLMSA